MTDLMPQPPGEMYDQEAEEPEAPPQRPHSKPIDAADVISKWTKADKYLLRERSNYQLNQSFFLGEQWVMQVNRSLQEIEWANARERDSRTTVDKFGPRTRNLLARFLPEELSFEAQADGMSDSQMRQKQLREQLLEGERTQRDWEDVRIDTMLDTLFGGTAGVSVEWDPDGYGDEDDAITDPFSSQTYPSGCVKLSALGILEFALEPGNKYWRDARWWIRATTAPPESVQERYDLADKPQPDARQAIGARHRTLLRDIYSGEDEDLKTTAIYIYYERPTRNEPGQVAHVVNGEVVEREEVWPFPFRDLNLYVFRGERVRGRWTGGSLLNTARPVQMAFNHIRSTILEHARKAANARIRAPEGSIPDEDSLTTEVGEVFYYTPDASGQLPGWMEAPQVQRWLSQEADRLEADLDDIFHTHAISRGQQIGDRNSGLALSILKESDDMPLSFIARDQAKGWGRLAELALMMMADKQERGSATVQTEAGPIQVNWSAADIGPNPRIKVPIRSTMPRTKVATQALMTNLFQSIPRLADEVDSAALARFLGVTDPEAFLASTDVNTALARWENMHLANGTPITPALYNKHDTHIAEHKREQNTPDYQFRDPRWQQLQEEHIAGHELLLQQEMAEQMAAQMPPGMGMPPGLPPGMPGMESPEGMPPPPGPPGLPPGPPPSGP